MSLIKEFKEFALKGNVVELAIAVVIGAAFGSIVTSMVEDVITPVLLQPALDAAGVKDLEKLTWGTVKHGKFLASVINFIIISFILFMIVKGMNRLTREKEAKAAPPGPPELTLQEKLLTEIRDSLKK